MFVVIAWHIMSVLAQPPTLIAQGADLVCSLCEHYRCVTSSLHDSKVIILCYLSEYKATDLFLVFSNFADNISLLI